MSTIHVSMIRPFGVRRVVGLGVRAGCGGRGDGTHSRKHGRTEHTEPGSARRRNEGTKARARFAKLRRNIALRRLQSADWKERAAAAPSSAPLARSTHGIALRGSRHPERFKADPPNPVRCFSPFEKKTAGIVDLQGYWVLRSTNPCPCPLRDFGTKSGNVYVSLEGNLHGQLHKAFVPWRRVVCASSLLVQEMNDVQHLLHSKIVEKLTLTIVMR